jgi:hypothetical protein
LLVGEEIGCGWLIVARLTSHTVSGGQVSASGPSDDVRPVSGRDLIVDFAVSGGIR